MPKYNVHPIDDDYTMCPAKGTIELPENATHREIIETLNREGFFKPKTRLLSLSIDDTDEETLYVEYAGRPEYCLSVVND